MYQKHDCQNLTLLCWRTIDLKVMRRESLSTIHGLYGLVYYGVYPFYLSRQILSIISILFKMISNNSVCTTTTPCNRPTSIARHTQLHTTHNQWQLIKFRMKTLPQRCCLQATQTRLRDNNNHPWEWPACL